MSFPSKLLNTVLVKVMVQSVNDEGISHMSQIRLANSLGERPGIGKP
jgi:hypothetical protein